MNAPASSRFLIAAFLALVLSVPLAQVASEARQGRRPQALEVFARPPTRANLRAFEAELEEASVAARAVRPWMQAAQFLLLRDAGEKALCGRSGWLFYRPGVAFLTQRPKPGEPGAREAVAAVAGFRDQLAARGIRLVVVPAPNKESVYPDRLARGAARPAGALGAETRAFLDGCGRAGIEVVDLFATFAAARARPGPELYLARDTHWSPAGLRLAAEAVAARLAGPGGLAPGPAAFDAKPMQTADPADLVRMLQSPPLEARLAPIPVECEQIIRRDTGAPFAADPASEVLVLGDSFLRIFEQDDPGAAGFPSHLARALGRPVDVLTVDGGASTLVRQELARRPQRLTGKKVVVWEFAEREIRLGQEGWSPVPLPAPRPP